MLLPYLASINPVESDDKIQAQDPSVGLCGSISQFFVETLSTTFMNQELTWPTVQD